MLTDPLKRMDHNKDLEGNIISSVLRMRGTARGSRHSLFNADIGPAFSGGVVGWGFDRKAAQERAKNYQWTHPGQMFSRGEQEGERKAGSVAGARKVEV